jgi:hypothetical protein
MLRPGASYIEDRAECTGQDRAIAPGAMNTTARAGVLASILSVAAGVSAACATLHAQSAAAEVRGGGVSGAVVDAGTAAPVEGAIVVLQPEVVGAFPAGPASGSPFAASSRTLVTGVDGSYRFVALASGVYRLHVSRLGYRPYSVSVELRGSNAMVVWIALEPEPIPLRPVRSRGYARGSYESADAFGAQVGLARLLAADLRRMRFLTTDARELTHADVVEAVTLGEPDVLRALQRLPGVTTRSDYTAELWTRGAPWSHTRVYFDGVPLFNPLHALGVLSGVGSSAIGAVWFHPGVRSAAIGEGVAGVVDLQSRRASGGGELNANADVSLVSAGLALDQRVLDGRAGWMLSGRHAYLDWLTGLARHATRRDDATYPYGFSEVAGSVDAWLGERTSIEASWLWERNHITSVSETQEQPLQAEWGNVMARTSINTRIGRINSRHTAALSWHDGLVSPVPPRSDRGVPITVFLRREGDTSVGYYGLTGTFWPEPASPAGPAWSVGYGIEQQQVAYYGPQVLPVPRYAFAPQAEDALRVTWRSALPMASLWGERLWSVGDIAGIRTGLRMEIGEATHGSGPVRWAPRVSARYAPVPEVALSAGISRVYQYTQAIAPGGLYLASLATTDVWILADGATPALRADIATAGLETWLAPGRAVTLNSYVRRSTGVATADPRPGRIYDRPSHVTGESLARGVELSVRQLTGDITGSASYTLSRADVDAAGMRYVASSDRRHVLSLTTMLRATPALRFGGAFTAASGVPFTRTIATAEECDIEPGCEPASLPWLAAPNAARAPTFASLDLLLDWSGRLRGMEVGAYAQLRNALGRDNATIYAADAGGCLHTGCQGDLRSEFERGIPRLPVIGVRVRH